MSFMHDIGHGWVDSHVHFADMVNELDMDVFFKNWSWLITHHFNMGTCADDWPVVLRMADRYEHVHPFVGLHPWYADRLPTCLDQLKSIWDDGYVGVGEIGLDRMRGPEIVTQVSCFRWQLEAGLRMKRPVSVHCVRAWGLMVDILTEYAPLNRRVVIHAFGGSADTARRLEKLGAMVSFSGTIMNDDRIRLHSASERVSADHIMLETDAPAQLPQSERPLLILHSADGRIYNHPANLSEIARRVTELRHDPPDWFEERVYQNSMYFYTGEEPD